MHNLVETHLLRRIDEFDAGLLWAVTTTNYRFHGVTYVTHVYAYNVDCIRSNRILEDRICQDP